jgi:hypothetical protein
VECEIVEGAMEKLDGVWWNECGFLRNLFEVWWNFFAFFRGLDSLF